MVSTPWQTEPMPFAEAAEMGTRKVINDHSTIGILVTSDGSFGEIPRANFVAAEEQVVRELKQIGQTLRHHIKIQRSLIAMKRCRLRLILSQKYGAPVALCQLPDT